MRRSREEAARTRRAAIEAAARLYRARGVDAVSIGDVMETLGMTAGGFYRHFADKDALVAEACAHAFAESAEVQRAAAGSAAAGPALELLLRGYLSEAHRDAPGFGCPVPALVSEMPRQPAPVRRAFTEGVKATLARIARASPGSAREAHTAALAAMAGALALSRAVDDPKLSAQLLRDVQSWFSKVLAGADASKRSAARRAATRSRAKRG